ncbi:MAG: hypothetical protein K6E10_10915 [Eubacterium sp.]|nr:hypothetical protein [Eubacterium sp.]
MSVIIICKIMHWRKVVVNLTKRNKLPQKKKRKKVILFLVEGDTDKITLEASIDKFISGLEIEDIIIKFASMNKREGGKIANGGDFTSDKEVYPGNIEEKVSYRIDLMKDDGKIYPKDVVKIIQLVDLDGAYVDKDIIIKRDDRKSKIENRVYFEDRIETDNDFSTRRNLQRKRENLDFLSSKETFKLGSKTIDYSIYFFSSNLEHFLYNEQNLSLDDKVVKSYEFERDCNIDLNYFYSKMWTGDYLLKDMTYMESWDYIRKNGNKSLSRCSNINILFSDLKEWAERYKNNRQDILENVTESD